MSDQNPYQQLGVTENSSFDEIQSAKTRLSQQYGNDGKALELIETAYDAIIMDRLKMRQEGRIKVPDRIRFPEKTAEKPNLAAQIPLPSSPSWLQDWLDTPSPREIGVSAIAFGVLTGAALLATGAQASILPTLLVVGVFANVYFLNRKEKRFGRSLLISLGVLLLGVLLGTVITRVVPGSSLPLSGEQLSCLISFVLFWLTSSFIR